MQRRFALVAALAVTAVVGFVLLASGAGGFRSGKAQGEPPATKDAAEAVEPVATQAPLRIIVQDPTPSTPPTEIDATVPQWEDDDAWEQDDGEHEGRDSGEREHEADGHEHERHEEHDD